MILSNALSIFLLDYDQNGVCNRNLQLIQDIMRSDEPDRTNFKCVCACFPNPVLLIKSATPGDIQDTFGHASIGNKSLGETVTAFALAGSLESPMVVSIDADITFSSTGEKIRLPVMKVLLRAAVDNLVPSKKLGDWASH